MKNKLLLALASLFTTRLAYADGVISLGGLFISGFIGLVFIIFLGLLIGGEFNHKEDQKKKDDKE